MNCGHEMSQTEAISILKDMLTKEISPEMSGGYANKRNVCDTPVYQHI